MKTLTVCVMSALALASITSASAAEANEAVVNRDFTDTVAPANQVAYEAGAKAYNQCLREHGSKYSWAAYLHVTGDVYKYSYVTGPYTWADFDTMGKVGEACDATWRSQANPHLKGETSAFMIDKPELSHMPMDWSKQAPPKLISVTYFTLKQGHAADVGFTEAVKKITAAAAQSKWAYYYRTLQVQGGDEGAPDYILVIPSKSWAEYGAEPDPSVWKMVEGVYGKADADALRQSINDSIEKSSEHVDRYSAELSYTADE